jgi:hypothetical protein
VNATATETRTCGVCHQVLESHESYLIQRRAGRSTAVHRHLCYPPAVAPASRELGIFFRRA